MATLRTVLGLMRNYTKVTLVDYLTEEIIVDCEPIKNIYGIPGFESMLAEQDVYRLQVGAVHGDIILHITPRD